jgi:glycosyltransferase involved in cell wall biosynthesis
MELNYSFVIPHHNTPDLLQRLIDTIPQREDIEVIIVDDNSDDDKKANIIRPDVKTIFIDKEHTKGAGRARNVGMDVATGKWLLFADADDLYKPGFIDVLDEYKDDDIEMLFYNIDSVDSDTMKPNRRSSIHNKLIEQFDGSTKSSNNILFFGYAPWRRMLLSEFVKKHGFRFEETVRGNDMFFSIQASFFVRQWKVDKRVIYTLTHHNGSLTFSKVIKDKYVTLMIIYRRLSEFYKFIGHPEWNKKSVRGIYSQSILRYLYRLVRRQPLTAIGALFYYLTHWYEIEIKSSYYVDVVKDINRKMVCNEILNLSNIR